jgi:hypothetical protein
MHFTMIYFYHRYFKYNFFTTNNTYIDQMPFIRHVYLKISLISFFMIFLYLILIKILYPTIKHHQSQLSLWFIHFVKFSMLSRSVFMKWWSAIPPIPTKWTIISHLNSFNTENTTCYGSFCWYWWNCWSSLHKNWSW